jgi:uncharacterized glyoxalase superfamily protein PhnB
MNVLKVTPLLVVDRIEPNLLLWEKLGFTRTVEVPHGDALGFVILAGKGTEVMLQSRESLRQDAPIVAEHAATSLLYCDVDSLAETRRRIAAAGGCTILIDERRTPYGARELWMVDGTGHVVGFAEHVRSSP